MTTALQNYLEMLYQRNAQNASPELRSALERMAVNNAYWDANYRGTVPNQPNRVTSPGARIGQARAAHDQMMRDYYLQLQKSRGFGSNAIPNMRLQPRDDYRDNVLHNRINQVRNNTIGTPNPNILRAEAERARVEALPHGQSLGKTSLDLDPSLQNPYASDLDAIEQQIRDLANTPDIPGQWISPYSQDYLNQLGDRLGAAGSAAQQAYQGAIGDIVSGYGEGTQQRASQNENFFNQLAANAGNIGVNYGQSEQDLQAASDAAYLDKVAQLNMATDIAANTRLGEIANQYGSNLGMQAREGLLTPKEYIGPQSGLTAGQQALMGFLGDKYQALLGQQFAEGQAGKEQATTSSNMEKYLKMFMPNVDQNASYEMKQTNPNFTKQLAGIEDPVTKDLAQQIYGTALSNPTQAIQDVQKMLNEIPNIDVSTAYGIGQNPRGAGAMVQQRYDQERERLNQLMAFFRSLSPGWGMVPTEATMTDKSTQDVSPYLPIILQMLQNQ